MTNAITICSNALMMLGSQPIASFSEAGSPAGLDRAKLCAGLYPMVRVSVLRSHPWNCAVRRVQLAPEAEPPAFGFAHRFALPGDWLRTLSVGDHAGLDYLVEGRYILADTRNMPLVYVANVGEDAWDAMLERVMTLAMAAKLAYPVTASASLAEEKYKEWQAAMQEARSVDGQEDPAQVFGTGQLLMSRFGGFWPGR